MNNPRDPAGHLNKLGRYGIDAPGIRRGMFTGGMLGLAVALLATFSGGANGLPGPLVHTLEVLGLVAATYGFFMGGYMTYASWFGKLKTRERLLDLVAARRPWSAVETVLDVGCGRGLLLVGAARRIKAGQAVGIDLWRQEDQADNAPEAALENARIEGVSDRVRVETGDVRALPYPSETFDVVVSHWVLHNLKQEGDRHQALDEILRVLRPGGVLALADIEHVPDYCDQLRSSGTVNLQFLDGGLEAKLMAALSGGTFCPQALIATKPASQLDEHDGERPK